MTSTKTRLLQQAGRAERLTIRELLNERHDQMRLLKWSKVLTYRAIGSRMIDGLEQHLDGLFIGSGWEALVFENRRSRTVQKVIIETMGLPSSQIEVLRRLRERAYTDAKSYIGNRWVDTDYQEMSIPVWLGGRALVAVQPAIAPARRFAKPEDVPAYRQSDSYRAEIGETIASIRQLHTDTGMYPDMLGAGNIVAAGNSQESLLFVDTTPESPERLQAMHWDRTMTRAEAMEKSIAFWERSLDRPSAGIV